MDLLIRSATLADGRTRDVRVSGERIAAVAQGLDRRPGEASIDATGKRLLPGMIDAHVHFREPGYAHKETWATGSASAAAGGVTTVVDQPNTDPPTVTGPAFDRKADFASASTVDYAINGGVTPGWDPDTLFDRPLLALGEIFLADSTGDMGVDTDLFRSALERATAAGVPVTVHAEDADRFDESALDRSDPDAWSAYRPPAAEVSAVERACDVAADVGGPLHVAHTSTPEAVDIAAEAGVTCEVTPHHLLLSRDDLPELGTFGRMNPPLRSEQRRAALFDRVADGPVTVVATDHAPHTGAEKDAGIWDAPSGVPGVETALPLLLAQARQGRLGYERVRDLVATNPARAFNLPAKGRVEAGRDADLVLVDPESTREIRAPHLHTKCDWTPFEGWQGVFPEWTLVRGRFVYRAGRAEGGRGSVEGPGSVGGRGSVEGRGSVGGRGSVEGPGTANGRPPGDGESGGAVGENVRTLR